MMAIRMSDINQLRRQFSIPGVVSIEPGRGGLARVAVTTDQAEAHVYLHGAHLTHFRRSAGQDVLFLSGKSLFEPGKAIRGGVPVIFPWFGAKADNPAAPAHGLVRTAEWELKDVCRSSNGAVALDLEFASSPQTLALWPHEFRLRYTVTVGESLELALEVRNVSDSAFRFEEALHTYLSVQDVQAAQIEGLAGREYLDKTDGMRRKIQTPEPIMIVGETDRVYLNTTGPVTVSDRGLLRQISVDKQGSNSTVVWNPWIAKAKAMADFGDMEWPNMLCIETANAGENAVKLEPGLSHRMTARISTTSTAWPAGRVVSRQWEMSQRATPDRT
jgi:D-hexose-6-phosphate mutarotase